jgi:ferric iron reductase protein FhuF
MTVVAAEPDEVRAAVRAAAGLNPLFALSVEPDDRGDESWLPATCLAPGDPAVHRLVARVGKGFGNPPARVGASMVLLGYSARLVAPTLATLLRDGLLPDVTPPQVCWRYRPGSGFQLRLPDPSGWQSAADTRTSEDLNGAATLVDLWCRDVVDDHLATVIAAVQAVAPVAAGLLWGNVASSLAGALRMLALAGPAPLHATQSLAETLLSYGPLHGTGHLSVRDGQLSFVRRSCCLYYTLPGGGMCGDCALLTSARRRP